MTDSQVSPILVKHEVARRLQIEIVEQRLRPGERIVEAKWANQLGVAQASIREAINILVPQGFVTKEAGRSARVTNFTEQDIAHIYEMRGVIEGLAVRLVATARPDLSPLLDAIEGMRTAVAAADRDQLLDYDLKFHQKLCELSGNPFLIATANRLLNPLFAFVRMRVAASGQQATAWTRDLEGHQRLVDLLSEGEAQVAEQYTVSLMARFAQAAYAIWEKREPESTA